MVAVRIAPESTADQYAGIYLPSEVASYLLVTMPVKRHRPTSQRILGWMHHGLVARERSTQSGRDGVLDFGGLVTCQALTLLSEAGFGLSDMLEEQRLFADQLGMARPFAHRTFWHAERESRGPSHSRLLSADEAGQTARKLLTRWSALRRRRLDFADDTGNADAWRPIERISLRPAVQFGQPCIEGTRIPTSSIWSYIRAGDSPRFIADAYGVDAGDVDQAVRWEERRRAELDASTAVPAR